MDNLKIKKTSSRKDLINPIHNEIFKKNEEELVKLRQDGVTKIRQLKEENIFIKKNKTLDKETKTKLINKNNELIAKAKVIKEKNKEKIKELEKNTVLKIKSKSKEFEKEFKELSKKDIELLKTEYDKKFEKALLEYKSNLVKINSKYNDKISDKENKKSLKEEIKFENLRYKSLVADLKKELKNHINKIKTENFNVYNNRFNYIKKIRDSKVNLLDNIEFKYRKNIYQFSWEKFLMNNGLYIAILIFFVFCCIYSSVVLQKDLLTLQNIFNILENSSTRMFYALGVAGLILIGGTDLSIGRMVALGSVITAVILHDGNNIIRFFNMPPLNFDAVPMFFRLLLALTLSISLCSLFSLLAGVFTAKFKMHPFISSLSTQLIIYGLLFFATQGTSAGSINDGIKDAIGGRWYIAGTNLTFPKLIIPMILIIFVIWFIWNKTKFGKNMYAVGGNSEAASVSGINVFKTTLFIFLLAGVCYGFGSFFEAFRANTSAGTGQGFELDAIAACVVGGISFSGGVGKVKGAVFGVLIFTALTYALNFLKIDTNIQFIFKGIIILTAVAIDCAKYLKKK